MHVDIWNRDSLVQFSCDIGKDVRRRLSTVYALGIVVLVCKRIVAFGEVATHAVNTKMQDAEYGIFIKGM